MTPAELARIAKREAGRPQIDERFKDEDVYLELRNAEVTIRQRLARHDHARFLLLDELPPVASSDGGTTYQITNPTSGGSDQLLYLQLWTPPGPSRGQQLYERGRGSRAPGYTRYGSRVVLTRPFKYSPGLYPMAIFADGLVDGTETPVVESSLPTYLHRAQALFAAASMAETPHSRVKAENVRGKANNELGQAIATAIMADEEDVLDEFVPWWQSPDLGPS